MRGQASYDDNIFLCYRGIEGMTDLDRYLESGGFHSWFKAQKEKNSTLKAELMSCSIRDAGFESIVLSELWGNQNISHLVLHGAQQIPGDFSLVELAREFPYLVLEGVLLSLYALELKTCEIIVSHESPESYEVLKKSLDNLKKHEKFSLTLEDLEIEIKLWKSPGVLPLAAELLEGLAYHGFVGHQKDLGKYKQACVQSLQLTMALPWLHRFGQNSFMRFKGQNATGTFLVSLGGDIQNPGLYEIKVDTPLDEIIEIVGGGVPEGKRIKAVLLNGGFGKVFHPQLLGQLKLCPVEWLHYGFRMGPCVLTVLDESRNLRDVLIRGIKHFKEQRNHISQAQYMAVSSLECWLEYNKVRSTLVDEQKHQAALLVELLRPLYKRLDSSGAYLFGQFVESLIEYYIDDLLPEKERGIDE